MKKGLLFVLFGLTIALYSCGDKGPDYDVIIETDFGNMKVMLYDETPKHKENFLKLTKEGFYDDLLFHRVISGFMVQGGDPDSKDAPAGKALGQGGPGYTIEHEIGFPHFKGTLAAARTGGSSNPQKRSSGSQFYLVQGNGPIPANRLPKKGYSDAQIELYGEIGGTPALDMDYTVFGEIIEGLEVVDKIAAVRTASADRPVEDVKMKIKLK